MSAICCKAAEETLGLARIWEEYGKAFLEKYPQPGKHLKVMNAITRCRKEAMGGRIERCRQCGYERLHYHSCGNRHCPQCGQKAKARWVEKRQQELLPITYFHNVFTLPHELNPVILCNKEIMLKLFFDKAAETLLHFGKNPKGKFKGQLGFTLFLHTWSQTLIDHFHLHVIIPGGALRDHGLKWIPVKGQKKYLFNVKNLSLVFRGKFMEGFNELYQKEQLRFPGKSAVLGTLGGFMQFCHMLYQKEWVVYSKATLRKPEFIIDYLSQYTHRAAISNYRIVNIDKGTVTFWYLNRRDKTKPPQRQKMTLTAIEFLRRFMLHILPNRFMRIRYYGFMSNRYRKRNIQWIKEQILTLSDNAVKTLLSLCDWLRKKMLYDFTRCPACHKGRMAQISCVPRCSRVLLDSS